MNKRKNRKIWTAAACIGLILTMITGIMRIHILNREKEELENRLHAEVQQGIAKEIFRLHVVANSDRKEDQDLKLEVKTGIVEYLKNLTGNETTREETKEMALTHLQEIEEEAEKIIKEKGYDYTVEAVVEKTYFPDKTYGDCTFPAGEYEALNVKIGNGTGHNWWCVLYPGLCFIDDTYGVVTEEGKEELEEILTEEEFWTIMQSPEKREKVRVGFKWL